MLLIITFFIFTNALLSNQSLKGDFEKAAAEGGSILNESKKNLRPSTSAPELTKVTKRVEGE